MEPQNLNVIYQYLYSAVMLIQYITLIVVGSASVLFMIICLVIAVCDCGKGAMQSKKRFTHSASVAATIR